MATTWTNGFQGHKHEIKKRQSELATHCHGTHDPVKDFELFFIDHGIKDLRAGESLEDYYICKLQTMAPHGMNTKINSYAKEMYASWSAVLKNDVTESQPTSQEWIQYLTSNIYTILSICPLSSTKHNPSTTCIRGKTFVFSVIIRGNLQPIEEVLPRRTYEKRTHAWTCVQSRRGQTTTTKEENYLVQSTI